MTGAAMRALLVALMVATPSLLLPGGAADEVVVLLALLAAALIFIEYNTHYPSFVEFRDAPPVNRLRFVSLLATVFVVTVICKHRVDPTTLKHYFLNQLDNEGPEVDGAIAFAPNGTPTEFALRNTDGDDAIFGDQGNDWIVGGTGRDHVYGGWGNDLMNADDVLGGPGTSYDGTNGLNDAPDTHLIWEDRVFGGAGLDILIGNTGGDRLIDWTGEYNSYIVPFAPFGIATVSRQVPPGLFDFLWAQAASDGADLTRLDDIGPQDSSSRYSNVAHLQAEPYGEMGLVTQKDHGLWQDQTGGPTDPQPGNIPGGARDVLRTADFNDGSTDAFAVDSGSFTASSGGMQFSSTDLGQDAAAVYYLDDYLPIYYEVKAKVTTEKPTHGWKANAFVIFDYFSPTDFKYAGINVSNNKIEMGYRDETGWHELVQSNKPVKIKPGRLYDVLVAVNGTNVTLTIENKTWFSFDYQPRILDGEAVGLNRGMVGIGAVESRGTVDNFKVQILPPEVTLDVSEDFKHGAELFSGPATGTWTVGGKRYEGTAAPGETASATVDLGSTLAASSYLDIEATFSTTDTGGVIFDRYADDDFKFVAIDVHADRLLFGHVDPKRGWSVDKAVARTFEPGVDYDLKLTFKGASVSAQVDGSMVGSFGYNSAVVDGRLGIFSHSGTASFDEVRIRTNDPAFDGDSLLAAGMAADPAGSEATVSAEDLAAMVSAARASLAASGEVEPAATLDDLPSLEVADLPGLVLARTEEGVIRVDIDAAGHGWFVDPTPGVDEEFGRVIDGGRAAEAGSDAWGRMDLLTAVTHELGHVVGLGHDSAAPFMAASLEPGQRPASEPVPAPQRGGDAVGAATRSAANGSPAIREQLFDDANGALLGVDEAHLLWRLGEEARREATAFAEADDGFLVDALADPDGEDDAPSAPAAANGVDAGGDGTPATRTQDGETAPAGGPDGGLIDWSARSSLVDRARGLASLLAK